MPSSFSHPLCGKLKQGECVSLGNFGPRLWLCQEETTHDGLPQIEESESRVCNSPHAHRRDAANQWSSHKASSCVQEEEQ